MNCSETVIQDNKTLSCKVGTNMSKVVVLLVLAEEEVTVDSSKLDNNNVDDVNECKSMCVLVDIDAPPVEFCYANASTK